MKAARWLRFASSLNTTSTASRNACALVNVATRSYAKKVAVAASPAEAVPVAATITPPAKKSTRSAAASKKSAEQSEQQTSGKNAALEAALKQVEQQYGKGAVMKFATPDRPIVAQDVIPTGSISLDMALGIGGLPRGRIVEIFGPEASGKTTFALQVIAQAQKSNGSCVFIDAEHALDPQYARRLGVKDDLFISQPDSGEQALEIADTLIRSGAVDVVVIDSVAALVPKAEIEGDMADMQIGLQARLMSKALRKLTASINKTKTLLIFINQIRLKIGVMFGNPETTSGGTALKFYSSVRLEVRRTGPIKKGETLIGNQVRVKVAKNKLAPPFRQVDLDLEFGKGISRSSELVDLGVKAGIVEKSGAWFSYRGEKIGQGRERAKQHLESNPSIAAEIEAQIMAANLSLLDVDDTGAKAEADAEDELEAEEAGDHEGAIHPEEIPGESDVNL